MTHEFQGVRFTQSPPRATPAAIRKTEDRLGTAFPEDYRQFLESVNGGAPTPNELPLADSDERVCIDFLFGVRRKREANDLLYQQERIIERTGGVLPTGFVTIGIDPGAAPYFIGTQGLTAGKIYIYDADGFLDANRVPRLHLVANIFRELLAKLAGDQ